MRHIGNRQNAQGATLIELMVALGILALITAGIFAQLNAATQRIATEQVKVDNFDEARDFVDQFFRDINQIGYPDGHVVTSLLPLGTPAYPATYDPRIAVGLVQISPTSIAFEGDINGSGVVQEVQYQINGSGSCSLCFQRSAFPKGTGDPLVQITTSGLQNWGTEVNDLTNTAATPIFTYYDATGALITPPATGWDMDNNSSKIASVKTIHISLTIQDPLKVDPKTGQPIQTSFEGEVSLNNCSLAAAGVPPMSCL
jgi:type II secretory pathway pseudopilin PulG